MEFDGKKVEKRESFIFNDIRNLRKPDRNLKSFKKKARKKVEFWGYEKDGEIVLHRDPREGPALIEKNPFSEEDYRLQTEEGFADLNDRSGFDRKGLVERRIYYKHGEIHRPFEEGPAVVKKVVGDSNDLQAEKLYGKEHFNVVKIWKEEDEVRRGNDPYLISKKGDFVVKKRWADREDGGPTEVKRRQQFEDIYQSDPEEADLIRNEFWQVNCSLHRHPDEGPARKKYVNGELVDEEYAFGGKDPEKLRDISKMRNVSSYEDAVGKIAFALGEDNEDAIREAKKYIFAHNKWMGDGEEAEEGDSDMEEKVKKAIQNQMW